MKSHPFVDVGSVLACPIASGGFLISLILGIAPPRTPKDCGSALGCFYHRRFISSPTMSDFDSLTANLNTTSIYFSGRGIRERRWHKIGFTKLMLPDEVGMYSYLPSFGTSCSSIASLEWRRRSDLGVVLRQRPSTEEEIVQGDFVRSSLAGDLFVEERMAYILDGAKFGLDGSRIVSNQ